MNFANIQEQGFIPLYTRDKLTKLTDALHTVYGFETDYKFITKRQMKNIQKKSKDRILVQQMMAGVSTTE